MKRVGKILFWLALAAYYFVALSFVSSRERETVCRAVEVAILDSARIHFVSASDILQIVDNSRSKMRGLLMDSIRTPDIEAILMKLPAIRNVEAYKTADGTVHIDVSQRIPLLRIINRYGESFYIDENGYLLRHTNRYSVHVLIASGAIDLRPHDKKSFNISEIKIPEGKRNVVQELFDLATWIDRHEFWKAQIQQLYLNGEGDIELIPLVGPQLIIFGRGDRIDEKFSMLESLYRNGFSVTGWNAYSLVNLKYEGQIVCTKNSN